MMPPDTYDTYESEPESITKYIPPQDDKPGYLITIIDRPPLSCERGWWANRNAMLEDVMCQLFDESDGLHIIELGWHASGYDRNDNPNRRLLTIKIIEEPEALCTGIRTTDELREYDTRLVRWLGLLGTAFQELPQPSGDDTATLTLTRVELTALHSWLPSIGDYAGIHAKLRTALAECRPLDDLTAKERDLILAGEVLSAIKSVRNRLDLPLREAKEFVDARKDKVRAQGGVK